MIQPHILGVPGDDNALFVKIDSGQETYRLLFDCGDCLRDAATSDLRATEHLFFSHLHMDHVSGFDGFFRLNFNRKEPVYVWGPPETGRIIHHRTQGFMWNYKGQRGTWLINDIFEQRQEVTRICVGPRDGFENIQEVTSWPFSGVVIENEHFTVNAIQLDHHTPSMGYIVREKPRLNLDKAKLKASGLPSGPWLQDLKDGRLDEAARRGPQGISPERLRAELLSETPGESVAYLTDFGMVRETETRLSEFLKDCTTLVCESHYRHEDLALATQRYHLTSVQAARLAARSKVGELVLIHVSDRYQSEKWTGLLAEAREVFPNTRFPAGWRV